MKRVKLKTNTEAPTLAERPNLINGGIQYFNLNKNEDALKYFAAYVDAATLPMMEKENLLEKDTILPQVAYYATLAADRVGDKDA